MRNLFTFSASAIIHSLIAVGMGSFLLTEPKVKTSDISEVFAWQWVEEVTPPPVVVEKASPIPQPTQFQPPEPQPVEKPEPIIKQPPPKITPQPLPKQQPKLVPAKKTKPKPKRKPKPVKKRPSRHVVKTKPVRKRQQTAQKIAQRVENAPPREPLFKDFSGQKKVATTRATQTGKREQKKSPPPPKKPTVSPQARANYNRGLRAAIERHKKYPRREQRMGITGVVVIAFQVNADGRLSNISVARSSGNTRLDAAARAAVAAVGRYQPPPHGTFNTSVRIGFELH